jgi:hypothetical protein
MSRSLRWAIPAAVAGCLALLVTGMYVFSPDKQTEEVVAENQTPPVQNRPKGKSSSNLIPAQRRPASQSLMDIGRQQLDQHQPVQHHSQFPTHVEMHQNDNPYADEQVERDPVQEQADQERQPAQEHSLVNNNTDGMTLDEAMNTGSVPTPQEHQEAPIVEEASDF